jgi:hypothetical protein
MNAANKLTVALVMRGDQLISCLTPGTHTLRCEEKELKEPLPPLALIDQDLRIVYFIKLPL